MDLSDQGPCLVAQSGEGWGIVAADESHETQGMCEAVRVPDAGKQPVGIPLQLRRAETLHADDVRCCIGSRRHGPGDEQLDSPLVQGSLHPHVCRYVACVGSPPWVSLGDAEELCLVVNHLYCERSDELPFADPSWPAQQQVWAAHQSSDHPTPIQLVEGQAARLKSPFDPTLDAMWMEVVRMASVASFALGSHDPALLSLPGLVQLHLQSTTCA